ncbi:YjaG family protein [Enterobacteriaceae bacterium LUAb1]
MVRNPIHLRLEKLAGWQHQTFMACLCERMYLNYWAFCQETQFGDPQLYTRVLDLVWEYLTVKDARINFDNQLEKLGDAIPSADNYDIYGIYPAIDACVALSDLLHSLLSGETLERAIEVSETSAATVAMLEMTLVGHEMSDEELKANQSMEDEWDIQWEIFRLLAASTERDIELIKGLRSDLRNAAISNIGISFNQQDNKLLSQG